ncbi:mitochondrial import receptor subunit [Microthyrium microscopicum]|uniref:Mitochondrial import receptor subunit n=1 Tax=Microthyrium microscopicum TaxID=703497 RepID=A0A6A6UCJ9_9PEZI|nr:mitochondrial import receptor subunit [Microthyrium microscopicum]
MDVAHVEKSKGSSWDFITSNAVVQRATEVISSLQEKRKTLGLSNPGNIDRIAREVENEVLLNNYSFTGLRADITKSVGNAPLFQVSHQFSTGSQMQMPYNFALLYGTPNVFMQANIDNERQLMARFNWRWNSALTTKTMAQLAPGATGQSMVSIENDYVGSDFTASIKAINPSLLEGGLTGMMTGEYLQSVTPKLSVGVQALWQRQAMTSGPDVVLTYAARYKSLDWIATAQMSPMGVLQTSYWRRIAENFQVGSSLSLQYMPGAPQGMMGPPAKAEGLATIGAKFDFRTSQVRMQVDSQGRIGAHIEKRIIPPVSVSFVGQIDHVKNESKIGLSISIESMTEEAAVQQEQMMTSGEMQSPPF